MNNQCSQPGQHPDEYDVYVFHRSYFCGKMLAYLRYKEIPHKAHYQPLSEVGNLIQENTGLRQMPVVKTPQGQWLQDSTPMINWFERRFQQAPLLPVNPVLRFLAKLLEDYADEWLWRPAIYYRWMHKADRYMYKRLFVSEFLGGFWDSCGPLRWVAGQLVHKHQKDKFLQGDGLTKENAQHVEWIYTSNLQRLEKIFQHQAYLLGERPCLADFGFFGSMFWHFSADPTSNRIMQEQAPGVNEWVARLWNARCSKFNDEHLIENTGTVLDLWQPILNDIAEAYLPYLEANAIEYSKQTQRFDFNVQGASYKGVHVSPYRVWCREKLQQYFMQLTVDEQEQVRQVLGKGIDSLMSHLDISSNWDPEEIAPLCRPGVVPLFDKLTSRFTGTNHVRTRRAWDKQ